MLTVGEAIQQAQASAPDVIVSTARAAASESEVNVAGILPAPRIAVGTTAGSARVFGTLFVALPIFGQRGIAMDAAEALAAAAHAGADVARLDARLAATVAWTDLWLAREEARVAQDIAARRERLVETARVRMAEGAGSRLDVVRLQTEAHRTRADADARRSDVDAARSRLCALLGRDPLEVDIEAAGDPPLAKSVPAPSELHAMVDAHALSRRAKLGVRAADAAIAREKRSRWPLIGVQIGAALANRFPPPTNDYSATLAVDLPIFSGPLVTRAEALRVEAQAGVDATVAALRGRLHAARASYLAADRRCRAAVEEVLPIAREASALAAEGYRSRGLDLTSTLAVEQSLADAELAAVRAQADRARAYAALEHAAGRPL